MTEQNTNPERTPLAEGGDPADYTVDEVNNHLATADDAEWARILDAEGARLDDARVGILDTPSAQAFRARQDGQEPAQGDGSTPETQEGTDDGNARERARQAPTTRGGTFTEAAEVATPDPVGYYGHSPAREAAGGKADKGLSQQSILKG